MSVEKPLPVLKLGALKTDRVRQSEGEWIDIPDWPGVAFRVRSLSHPPYVFARDRLNRKLARLHPGNPGDAADQRRRDDERSRLHGELLAEHVLLEWRGFDMPYSAALAEDVLTDPTHEQFMANLTWAASRVGQGKAEFAEGLEKN